MGGTHAKALGLGCALALAALCAGCGDGRPLSGTIVGASEQAPEALLRTWGRRFEQATGATVRVRAGGLARLAAGRSAFAVADGAPAPAGGGLVSVPVAVGSVAIAYNVGSFSGKRIESGVRLDGHRLASIYRGPTFSWHVKGMLALNPGVDFPDELIEVCRHVGSWGLTAAFTAFLSRSAPKWASGPGSGTHVEWPRLAAPGIDTTDVAACVKRTGGSIGYVAPSDAARLQLTTAVVRWRAGPYRAPGQPGYPITAQRYVVVWRDPCRAGLAEQAAVDVAAWLRFALGPGQALAARAGFAPLAADARAAARAQVAALRCDGRPIAVPR